MDLFSKQSPVEAATKTAASKLSNGAAIIINDLTKEPTRGLMHVLRHVQKSVPILLETHTALEAAAVELQAVLEQLQDAQEGVMSVTSPATQQDLASLASSMQALDNLAQQLQQQQQLQQPAAAGQAAPSSNFAKLWQSS
ncbi:hypothetical protein OEZ86_013931 [Tetradesmus obliquus]|uniref:Uncharacterized protein n=2 Tax=Tetradesmus obliquus TaxID=3088 RepID=A0A383VPT7_TETOB|nr:hypothetical protein OEZ85_006134 [Tetradesmus obliquus]WIA40591.1 hypothetical protein OEZ86_013931 [Tetradesmus obliquus]|eukprot:jgi/Sobl393_1/6143/SZX67525.1